AVQQHTPIKQPDCGENRQTQQNDRQSGFHSPQVSKNQGETDHAPVQQPMGSEKQVEAEADQGSADEDGHMAVKHSGHPFWKLSIESMFVHLTLCDTGQKVTKS